MIEHPSSRLDRHLQGLSASGWDELRRELRSFLEALRRGERPAIEDHLPAGGAIRRPALVEMIFEELESRRSAGDPANAEDYLARFPELRDDPEDVRCLLEVDARLRCVEGRAADSVETTRRLGRFVAREELGRGGSGIVYLAVDERLGRDVALKLPRPGAIASADDEDRFLREARSVARLSHPNIVPVYEAGLAEGTLYLVSAYIPGATLAAWAEERRPTTRQAAEVAATLAEALEHAHGHGVIHRDIKPSNILVDLEGRPHLADFGLAKSSAFGSTLTLHGQVLGTPAYMPPEQARGDARTADARSDVYSLGVVLYELIAGTPPFQGTPHRVLRQIIDDDPRPLRSFDESIARDLETICLKAMAKDPARRYATAADFAADLRRFLRGEPVRARPVGRAARLWRLCRRKPIASGSIAAVVIVGIGSLAVVTWQWRRAEGFRVQAETGLADARRQHTRILRALTSGQGAIDFLTVEERVFSLPLAGTVPPGQETSQGALDHYQRFLDQLRAEPSLRPELLAANLLLACLTTEMGRSAIAAGYWQSALGIAQGLVADEPANTHLHFKIVCCHRALATFNRDGGRLNESERHLRQAMAASLRVRELLDAADRGHPDDVELQELSAKNLRVLGSLCLETGGPPSAALPFLERSLRTWERMARVSPQRWNFQAGEAECRLEIGRVHCGEGRLTEASRYLGLACETFQRLTAERPDKVSIQVQLANSLAESGRIHGKAGHSVEAVRDLDQARRVFERLVREYPSHLALRRNLARCCLDLADSSRTLERPKAALSLYRRAIDLCEDLVAIEKSDRDLWIIQAHLSFGMGAALDSLDRTADALESFRRAAALFGMITRMDPREAWIRQALAASYHKIGCLLTDLHQPEAAQDEYRHALELREALVRERPEQEIFRSDCGGTWHRLGETLERLGQDDEAIEAYRKAIAHQRIACDRSADSSRYRRYLDGHLANLHRLEQAQFRRSR